MSDPRHVEWERLDVEPIRHRLATHYNATDVEQEAEDVSALLAEVDRLREENERLKAALDKSRVNAADELLGDLLKRADGHV